MNGFAQGTVTLKPGLTESDAAQSLANLQVARRYAGQVQRELEAGLAQNQARAARLTALEAKLASLKSNGLSDYYLGMGDDANAPVTDYANGILRGWTRSYTKHWSVFFSVPSRGYTKDQLGSVPTVQEWSDFDAKAHAMGVDSAEVGRRLLAARAGQKSNFFDKASQAIKENPISELGRKVDKTLFRPVTGKLEKAVGAKVYGILKSVVQYGSMALDLTGVGGALVGPGGLPFLKAGLDTASSVPIVGKAGATLVTPTAGGTPTQVGGGAFTLEDKLNQAASVLSPVKFQAGRFARVFANAQGGAGAKLLAVGEDFVHEVGVCITLVSAVGGLLPGFATDVVFDALNLAQTALQEGIDLNNTYQAAQAAKQAAKQAHDLALAQASELDKQTTQVLAEIDAVKRQRASLEAKRSSVGTGRILGRASETGAVTLGKVALAGALIYAALEVVGGD